MEIDIKAVMAAVDRRDFLCRKPPHCPKCDSPQVQIMEERSPAKWKCRKCRYDFIYEPAA